MYSVDRLKGRTWIQEPTVRQGPTAQRQGRTSEELVTDLEKLS